MLSDWGVKIVRAVVPRGLRNWLRSPRKSMRWVWDSVCFFFGKTKELALLPGFILVCHPRIYRIFLYSQLTDPEQSAEFRNFASYCGPSMQLLDIGASYGAFSFVAAHFGGTSIAVDPSPIATRLIRLQSRLSGCENNIRIVEACVTEAVGEIQMLSSGVFSDGYFRVTRGRSSQELTKTAAVTIDQLVERFGQPTHIKIDVEGHEAAVIRGARQTLDRSRPVLFLELHNDMIRADGGNPGSVVDDLAASGYELFSIEGVPIGREAILQTSICRMVGKPRSDK
jgi:FkbM family methyltransferase